MTLNLSKHGAEMQAAWKKVCDAKDPTDWALYGYEGKSLNYDKIFSYGETMIIEENWCSQYFSIFSIPIGNTFDLKLISTGEDGIEEMIEDLNANKILYAFIKGKSTFFVVVHKFQENNLRLLINDH